MPENELPAILASQVQDLLLNGIPISVHIINHDNLYLATITAYETHARIDGRELGFLVVGDALVATTYPAEIIRIVKSVVGEFDNLSIHGNPSHEELDGIKQFTNDMVVRNN